MLANKDADLLHPGIAISDIIPNAVLVRRRWQKMRRAAFGRQFDSTDKPNAISGGKRLPNFFQNIVDRMLGEHFFAKEIVTMDTQI